MRRLLALPAAAVLAASGCLGSSTATTPAKAHRHGHVRPYAVLRVTGTYATCPKGRSGGDLCGDRFTLRCPSPGAADVLWGEPPWSARLCRAILDYRTAIRLIGSPECNCPASAVRVHVRGRVEGRLVREDVAPCTCGESPEAVQDARVILRTHPTAG